VGCKIATVWRSGAPKIILPSASRISANLVPIFDDGGSATFDDVVLGDLACLYLLVLENWHCSSSFRPIGVSHLASTVEN
jgi:hypothetical protein